MTSSNRGFGSDNHSGVHPQILEAILKANGGHAAAYGTDEVSRRARRALQGAFGPRAADGEETSACGARPG